MMRSLEHQGVTTIFGYPGGSIMPTFDANCQSPKAAPTIAKVRKIHADTVIFLPPRCSPPHTLF